ncbi:MAG TPA: tRNA (N(6)-L-threonylcarbamoyladenosine(37)-C(2))-methylthiotransferase MtaB [Rectinemataceae bacterium]|nr:tRNA (N(6)-L-threonylcarbamoyladenosine(37)-C(2))-methylthiotransferase MtaB [Rectinemataceae bacterium]
MRLGVAFHTLGCKLNQLESEALADSFRSAGAQLVAGVHGASDDNFDLLVLNSCTVTGKAEQKARRLIRTALASHPDAVVLATGCYAQLDAAALEALHERVVVVPGEAKAGLLGLATWLFDFWGGHGDLLEALHEWKLESTRDPGRASGLASGFASGLASGGGLAGADERGRFDYHPASFAFHSRPALKVQDGCDNRCSYCRVCLARGPSRSLPVEEALARAQQLEAAGRAEIVLTGVNLSQYRDGSRDFPGLLARLIAGTHRVAYRISSYEPNRVNPAFLEVFADPRVRAHVHLAVQSGSDSVLGRMGRAYRSRELLDAAGALRTVRGDPFLAADIIAGFPGETDEEFKATLGVCKEARFAWIHAFPFSPRPGTRAEALRPRVPERVAGERVAALNELAWNGRADYVRRWSGSEVEAVFEGGDAGICEGAADDEAALGDLRAPHGGQSSSRSSSGGGQSSGPPRRATSENYLKLRIWDSPADTQGGRAFTCRISGQLDPRETGMDAEAEFLKGVVPGGPA